MLISSAETIDLKKFYFRWKHKLPVVEKRWWFLKDKKEVEIEVWGERKYQGRVMCGLTGYMIRILEDGKPLRFKKFLYTVQPIEYYALETEDGRTLYFNNSDYNRCLHVVSFNECLDELTKAAGW